MQSSFKTLLLMLLMLRCLSTVAFATVDKPLFREVPRGHWAYKALDTLEKAGIPCHPAPCGYSGSIRGWRAMTRYEFAVATERALKKQNAIKKPSGGKHTGQPSAFEAATRKLALEFRAELAEINPPHKH